MKYNGIDGLFVEQFKICCLVISPDLGKWGRPFNNHSCRTHISNKFSRICTCNHYDSDPGRNKINHLKNTHRGKNSLTRHFNSLTLLSKVKESTMSKVYSLSTVISDHISAVKKRGKKPAALWKSLSRCLCLHRESLTEMRKQSRLYTAIAHLTNWFHSKWAGR